MMKGGTEMTAALVPFGKYKGQPVEQLTNDREYCDWLVGQDWFRERYPPIYTLIVNNFGEAAETPEHNALQAKFTDAAWVRRFIGHIVPFRKWFTTIHDQLERVVQLRDDAVRDVATMRAITSVIEEWAPAWMKAVEEGTMFPMTVDRVAFEVKGADVELHVTVTSNPKHREFFARRRRAMQAEVFPIGIWSLKTYRIECKPSLGDDYPAVLRQMRAHECNVLLVGKYYGTGATLDQVRDMFGDIRIVFVDDVR